MRHVSIVLTEITKLAALQVLGVSAILGEYATYLLALGASDAALALPSCLDCERANRAGAICGGAAYIAIMTRAFCAGSRAGKDVDSFA